MENGESLYHETLEELLKNVESATGSKNLKTFDSCKKALETYSRNHSDLCYTLAEFDVVE